MKKKRFIAGATCPKCKEMDTLLYAKNGNGIEEVNCVVCDYTDEQDSNPKDERPVNQTINAEKQKEHELIGMYKID